MSDNKSPWRIELREMPAEWYAKPILFRIEDADHRLLEQDVLYSQLTLWTLLTEFGQEFNSVLDIGSHWGNVSNILKFVGKRVTNCEPMPGCETDYAADYLTIKFPEKFDAIWCSQVLEHQRNVGFFLNKIFDDLKDDGILALTVPMQVDTNLGFGHCNLFTPLIIIYHLCCAGFSCRDIKLKLYGPDICVILRKRYNGIKRDLSMGSLPETDKTSGYVEVRGKKWNIKQMLGAELFPGMTDSFPPVLRVDHQMSWPQIDSINWPDSLPAADVASSH